MADRSPENDAWLQALVDQTPLLPDPLLRAHWRRLIPWLSRAARYELAAILLDIQHACSA